MTTATDKLQTTEKHQAPAEIEDTKPGAVFTPAVDIFEKPDLISIVADMPGVTTDGLEIDLRENVLTLRGEVAPLEQPGEMAVHREFESGTFYRQFRLSDKVDQQRIDARLVDGVLTLKLPKVEAEKPRQIEVKSG